MLKKFSFFKKLSKQENIEQSVKNADLVCRDIVVSKLSHLDILDYRYSTKEARQELGLDDELIHQLVEDYVAQIIKASVQFEKYLANMTLLNENNTFCDYTPLRELVHKNLGVARNLRIKDAEILLYEMMIKEDLKYLGNCLQVLKACAIKLKPECAYNTFQLIELKNSL